MVMEYRQTAVKVYDAGTSATKATTKWQKKKGLISKSYKLNRAVAEAFAEACESTETTQAKELTGFMRRFITKNHPKGKEALT